MTAILSGLAVHPLKSGAVRPVERAEVGPAGLATDRSWMVVDAEGVLVSARDQHNLLRVVADTAATAPEVAHGLRLRAAGLDDLQVAEPHGGTPVDVQVHSSQLTGVLAAETAHRWLQQALGRPDVRLVWCADPTSRRLPADYARPGEHTAFADSFPITIATESSLARLNDWIAQDAVERGESPDTALPLTRFRANLTVAGTDPFTEDAWRYLEIGEVRLRVVKKVSRCVLTTVNSEDLTRSAEPIRTLARYRRFEGKTCFAVHAIAEKSGSVAVGSEIKLS